MRDSVSEFRNVMRAAGIEPPAEVTADGELHRFRVKADKAGTCNGWYVLHVDGVPAGAFVRRKQPANEKLNRRIVVAQRERKHSLSGVLLSR